MLSSTPESANPSATSSASIQLPKAETVAYLISELELLRTSTLALEQRKQSLVTAMPQEAQPSVRNLLHYIAIRQKDLRDLQPLLSQIGLSSLGRLESHALAQVEAVLTILYRLRGDPPREINQSTCVDLALGSSLLRDRTIALFGYPDTERDVRVMVTMPTQAAADYEVVRSLLAAGMDVMRINLAHDGPKEWLAMIDNLRRAERDTGRTCKVMCDLAGPKLRTGKIENGPGRVRWHAFKDLYGKHIAPAKIWLSTNAVGPNGAHAAIPLSQEFLNNLQVGDQIHFTDNPRRNRWIDVVKKDDGGFWAHGARGAFLIEGLPLEIRRAGNIVFIDKVQKLPELEKQIDLKVGDSLIITKAEILGRPAQFGAEGQVIAPAQIGCSLPEIFTDARVGQRILFDDGRILGVIREISAERIEVKITNLRSLKGTLRGDKGINLPDTDLKISSSTLKDQEDLKFVSEHADIVALSFTRNRNDVLSLYQNLDALNANHLGVVFKIETKNGFKNLGSILLSALTRPAVGVMVARGDLGVEIGFERMAEAQEEILCMAEAAHIPVIWATQVLETLAKVGAPSRAEITDAFMGGRAECVMLNKGPFIVEAVHSLSSILGMMGPHFKKSAENMRKLNIASTEEL